MLQRVQVEDTEHHWHGRRAGEHIARRVEDINPVPPQAARHDEPLVQDTKRPRASDEPRANDAAIELVVEDVGKLPVRVDDEFVVRSSVRHRLDRTGDRLADARRLQPHEMGIHSDPHRQPSAPRSRYAARIPSMSRVRPPSVISSGLGASDASRSV